MPLLFVLAASLVTQGCTPRVAIPDAPPKEAPLADRVAYHEEHKAVALLDDKRREASKQPPVSAILANNVHVRDPRDLKPAVGNDTLAAEHIAGYEHRLVWQGASLGVVLSMMPTSVGSMLMGLFVASTVQPNAPANMPRAEIRDKEQTAIVVGAVGCGIAGAIALMAAGSMCAASDALDIAAADAFAAYNQSLKVNLVLAHIDEEDFRWQVDEEQANASVDDDGSGGDADKSDANSEDYDEGLKEDVGGW